MMTKQFKRAGHNGSADAMAPVQREAKPKADEAALIEEILAAAGLEALD